MSGSKDWISTILTGNYDLGLPLVEQKRKRLIITCLVPATGSDHVNLTQYHEPTINANMGIPLYTGQSYTEEALCSPFLNDVYQGPWYCYGNGAVLAWHVEWE